MSTMRLSMRAGERLYINGAALRFGRRTEIELMNDAAFLLEAHVMQEEDATTPLRQLYFILQTMLIDPDARETAAALFAQNHVRTLAAIRDATLSDGLRDTAALVSEDRVFEAMKMLRGLFGAEERLIVEDGDAAA